MTEQNEKKGLNISVKSFVAAILVLLVLMVLLKVMLF